MRKPLVVLVSGAPGSGKTTLAGQLADYMRLPHIERDKILRGMEFTSGEQLDKAGVGVPVYYSLLQDLLKRGISFVTDGTLYKNISEVDIKSQLLPHAQTINVHTRAKDEHQRFYDREINRKGVSKDWKVWLELHMSHLKRIYASTVDPLELNIPLLEVESTDEYAPSIAEIAARINEIYTGEPSDLWDTMNGTESTA